VILATANVLAFIALLASRPPEYERLREHDKELRGGGSISFSSADPIHLAGRRFYSSAHTYVPLVEDLYFMANFPGETAMVYLAFPSQWWTGSWRTSTVR